MTTTNFPAVSAQNLLNPQTYINRELSTIAFQRRVLELAKDDSLPLLERIKFVAIVGNNLDEFYMVRVASYVRKVRLGIGSTRPDGYTPQRLLHEIRQQVAELMKEQRQVMNEIFEQLKIQDVALIQIDELTKQQRQAIQTYFDEEVFPVLTPLAVDHVRPFPFISNLSLNLGVYLQRDNILEDDIEFVRIKIPDTLPRIIDLAAVFRKYHGESVKDKYLFIEDIILDNLLQIFPGMRILEAHPFRVLRNTDIDYEHEQDEELLDVKAIIEQGVRQRQFGNVVRLSVQDTISKRMLSRLIEELGVDRNRDVYTVSGALGSADLFELASIDRPDLKYEPHKPKLTELVMGDHSIFSRIRVQDLVLHHPYDSFSMVEDFFISAARDPDVLAIKATLYRVGKNSPVVNALMEARENQKQVAVLVELKARFDEENNLEWVRALERKGVHVIYGVEELPVKTHAKVALVVRREVNGLRRYVHLSTGNYNASTARLYTDIGLFTANKKIADDTSRLFNRLTGFAPNTKYKRLLVAPEYLFSAFTELIDNEIEVAKAGGVGHCVFKANQLEEDAMIQKLYEASQAGVQIDLIIRGLCCLIPGIEGISENIRVYSMVGRFLEHSRIYYFKNAPKHKQLYAGSADIMRRNLYNRVEVIFPILDMRVQKRVMRILLTNLRDNQNLWELHADHKYYRVEPTEPADILDAHQRFMQTSFGSMGELV